MSQQHENNPLADFKGFDPISTEALAASATALDQPTVAFEGDGRFIVASDAASPDRLPGLMDGVSPAVRTELIMRAVATEALGKF